MEILMATKLKASPAAVEMVERLSAQHGQLAFFQSGGCCDGSSPICLKDGELPPSGNDLLLGEIAGAPFYVDREQYERWGRPSFLIDVGSGPAEGFSLSEPDAHFVTRDPGG
jgi:uncharacterized protein (DUF779 family)